MHKARIIVQSFQPNNWLSQFHFDITKFVETHWLLFIFFSKQSDSVHAEEGKLIIPLIIGY